MPIFTRDGALLLMICSPDRLLKEEIMQVIIVGCGKVGRNLAEQLQAEDIDITLVDVIADKINDLCEISTLWESSVMVPASIL